MKRRSVLVSLGGLAGAGGIAGTGAFTSVSADRSIDVAVVGDSSALLRLGPCSGSSNGGYVTDVDDGTLELALSSSEPTDAGGEGVNSDATTVIDDVFEICNQGTQPVGVWLDIDPIENANGEDAISLYQDGDQSLPIVGEDNAVCLGVGECVCIGIVTRTQGVDPGTNLLQEVADGSEMLVTADAEAACAPPLTGEPQSLDTGTADWEVEALPGGVSPPDGKSTPYDATTITTPNDLYYDPSGSDPKGVDAQWIGPFDADANDDDPADADEPYVYEVDFTVDAGARDLVVEWFGSDNPVEFYLDGTKVGESSDGESFRTLEAGFTEPVTGGDHTLQAQVINEPVDGGNPTGLLVDARLE